MKYVDMSGLSSQSIIRLEEDAQINLFAILLVCKQV